MIIELLFVVAFITYIAIYVWSTKRNCKSNELKTVQFGSYTKSWSDITTNWMKMRSDLYVFQKKKKERYG